ncbi:MAG: hypothetical protein IPM98_16235 [Lewinellaceae bacterium]|nr:hypothetical protein [Lewinellaceae bacterium]
MAKVRTNTKGPFEEGSFDYDEFEKEAISRLKEGAGLVGSGGVLTGLIQCLVNAALGGEMNAHLKEDRAVEALHRQIRKVAESKGWWVNDKALHKQLYLILAYGRKQCSTGTSSAGSCENALASGMLNIWNRDFPGVWEGPRFLPNAGKKTGDCSENCVNGSCLKQRCRAWVF